MFSDAKIRDECPFKFDGPGIVVLQRGDALDGPPWNLYKGAVVRGNNGFVFSIFRSGSGLREKCFSCSSSTVLSFIDQVISLGAIEAFNIKSRDKSEVEESTKIFLVKMDRSSHTLTIEDSAFYSSDEVHPIFAALRKFLECPMLLLRIKALFRRLI